MISTHVLNAVTGRPAAGMGIGLEVLEDESGWQLASVHVTDSDGRVRALLAVPEAGTYRLIFATGDYFADQDVETFYPEVVITVAVTDPAQAYHVPLLLSPYAYSTYRGS